MNTCDLIGRLFLIGGRAMSCLADFVSLAGGVESDIVVLPHASSVPAEVASEMVATLRGMGVTKVRAVMPGEVLDLKGVDAVYMLGGDQSNLVDRLGAEGVAELRRAFSAGVLVAGSSAGAACVGEYMISGGMTDGSTDASTLESRSGLGLLFGLVVDTHFAERSRFARPGAVINRAVQEGYGLPSALGLDEDTAAYIEIRKGKAARIKVFGEGKVWAYVPKGRAVARVTERRRKARVVVEHSYAAGECFKLKGIKVSFR
ncbi:MAG: cyanophycinase [Leptolyngbya sp.]|nr:cyanophycinase [Candidatus Melainabacteria bacterium]